MTNPAALLQFSLYTRLRAASTWVLATVFLSLALMSVLTARYANALLTSLADPAIAEALQSQLHPPTVADVWVQWLKNLTQIGSLVMVVIAATTLQPAAGPAVMILSRGVRRGAYLSAQVAGFLVAALAVTVAAVTVLWCGASIVFGIASPLPIIAATVIWWLQASCFVLIAVLAAAAIGGVGASAGAGIGAFFVSTLLTWWPPAVRYSPAGLGELASAVAGGEHIDAANLLTLAVSAVVCAGLWALAVFTFARREL